MSRPVFFLSTGILLFIELVGLPAAAQITSNTALPVTEGHGILRVQSKVIQASGDDPTAPELDVYGFPVVGVYGVTSRWTVFGVAPILNKKLVANAPQDRIERGPHGLGDVRLFARYRLWRNDNAGETQRLAALGGMEVPTGADDRTDSRGRLPQPLQLGSGSWDPFGGLVFTWQTLQWQMDLSSVYQLNTEANDFQFGDEVRLDVASKYRLWPHEIERGVPGFVYANLETNLVWQGRNVADGREDPNSGGTIWFVAPGVQYITQRLVIECAVQLPTAQDRNGTALEDEFITTLSVRINI